jgi:hypothetical protein
VNVAALAEFARKLDDPIVLLPIEDYEPMAALIEREYPGVLYGWSELVPEGTALIVRPLNTIEAQIDRRFIQCFPGPPMDLLYPGSLVSPRREADLLRVSAA